MCWHQCLYKILKLLVNNHIAVFSPFAFTVICPLFTNISPHVYKPPHVYGLWAAVPRRKINYHDRGWFNLNAIKIILFPWLRNVYWGLTWIKYHRFCKGILKTVHMWILRKEYPTIVHVWIYHSFLWIL